LAKFKHSTLKVPILALNFVDSLIFQVALRMNFIALVVVYFLDVVAYALKSFESVVDRLDI